MQGQRVPMTVMAIRPGATKQTAVQPIPMTNTVLKQVATEPIQAGM